MKILSNSSAEFKTKRPILISACLLGITCRYDGGHSQNRALMDLIPYFSFIPICPEQLGGLSTPRPSSSLKGGDGFDALKGNARLIGETGHDVTAAFLRGARISFELARMSGSCAAILKSRSPSCGSRVAVGENTVCWGMGVTAALFRSRGIRIFDLEKDGFIDLEDVLSLYGQ